MASETSIIGAGMTVKGTLTSTADVAIDGKVEGEIRASGNITVSEGGKIVGDLYAEQAVVRGQVDGCIRARKVLLSATCKVTGDIFHSRLGIEDGAYFEGNCRHAEDPANTVVQKDFPRAQVG